VLRSSFSEGVVFPAFVPHRVSCANSHGQPTELSPELAAGISRVKGVKQLGFRSGNWVERRGEFGSTQAFSRDSMRAKRDYAMLAMLFGCGFRRSELVGLEA
jgi:hypothetical protein